MHSLRPPVVALTLLITASAALGVLVGVVASRGSVVAAWSPRPDVIVTSAGWPRVPGNQALSARAADARNGRTAQAIAPGGTFDTVPPISLSGVTIR